jgi:hypothetical protein
MPRKPRLSILYVTYNRGTVPQNGARTVSGRPDTLPLFLPSQSAGKAGVDQGRGSTPIMRGLSSTMSGRAWL